MIAPGAPFAQIIGAVVYGSDDVRIGQVRRVLLDEVTHRPEWAAVATGVLGARQRLIPVSGADLSPHQLRVPFAGDDVVSSPRFDPRDSQPSPEVEEQLYRHHHMLDTETEPGRDANDRAEQMTQLFVELIRGYKSTPGIFHTLSPGNDQAAALGAVSQYGARRASERTPSFT